MTSTMIKHLRIIVFGLVVWTSWDHLSGQQQRALSGSAIGATGGAVVGALVGAPLVGALIGSAGGAAVAALSK